MSLDSTLGRLSWPAGIDDIGTHHVNIVVVDSHGETASQAYDLTVTADTEAPRIGIWLSGNPIDVGTSLTVLATAVDNVGVDTLALAIGGNPVVLDGTGRATTTMNTVGLFDVTVTATDAAGNVGVGTIEVAVLDPYDVEAPALTITSPGPGDEVTAPIDVIGSVQDDNLDYYTLSVAPFDGGPSVEIATGTAPVDGVLGRFDPSSLANGTYTLRLYAIDKNGLESSLEHEVYVTGDLKLGNFTLSFTDLSIPVSGIPITVTRTYDSLNADSRDDLGYGWRLELRDTNVQTSVPETGMEDDLIFNPYYYDARVFVTLPGGDSGGVQVRAQVFANLREALAVVPATGYPAEHAADVRAPVCCRSGREQRVGRRTVRTAVKRQR